MAFLEAEELQEVEVQLEVQEIHTCLGSRSAPQQETQDII